MFITKPNDYTPSEAPRIFRRHRMSVTNGRTVRPGFDSACITGYHQLFHGYELTGETRNHDTDIAAAPLDAPDRMPAGSCVGHDGHCGDEPVRYANQSVIHRG